MSNPYGQAVTAEDILAVINKRKQISTPGIDYFARSSNRESANFVTESSAITSNRSREQLNNTTIKELNNTSREARGDEIDAKSLLSQKQNPEGITGPRLLTYRGISVQQCCPREGVKKQGLKLAITLQTDSMAEQGERLLVTAELKRYDRLREIKPRLDDSNEFSKLLEDTKSAIHSQKSREFCMGRIHKRGKRSQWLIDCLVVGVVENDKIVEIVLHLEGEEYAVKLDQELSDAQLPLYLSNGQWGDVVNVYNLAPRLSQLKTTAYGR